MLLNAGANKIKSTIWGSRARHAARARKVRHRGHFAAAIMSLNLCASASSRVTRGTLPLLDGGCHLGWHQPRHGPLALAMPKPRELTAVSR